MLTRGFVAQDMVAGSGHTVVPVSSKYDIVGQCIGDLKAQVNQELPHVHPRSKAVKAAAESLQSRTRDSRTRRAEVTGSSARMAVNGLEHAGRKRTVIDEIVDM